MQIAAAQDLLLAMVQRYSWLKAMRLHKYAPTLAHMEFPVVKVSRSDHVLEFYQSAFANVLSARVCMPMCSPFPKTHINRSALHFMAPNV